MHGYQRLLGCYSCSSAVVLSAMRPTSRSSRAGWVTPKTKGLAHATCSIHAPYTTCNMFATYVRNSIYPRALDVRHSSTSAVAGHARSVCVQHTCCTLANIPYNTLLHHPVATHRCNTPCNIPCNVPNGVAPPPIPSPHPLSAVAKRSPFWDRATVHLARRFQVHSVIELRHCAEDEPHKHEPDKKSERERPRLLSVS